MLIILASLFYKTADQYSLQLIVAALASVLVYKTIKKARKNFLLNFFLKRFLKKKLVPGMQDTRGGRILLGLILSLGTGGLIGLFFGWSIGLWVAAGLGIIMLIYFLSGEKTPKPLTPEARKRIERRNEIERKRRLGINY